MDSSTAILDKLQLKDLHNFRAVKVYFCTFTLHEKTVFCT